MSEKTKVVNKAEKIADFLKKVNAKFVKEYGDSVLYKASDVGNFKPLQTGFANFDWINSGIGGFPRGGMTLIHGAESTGKTTFCLDAIKFAMDKDPDCRGLFIDVESSLTESFLDFKKIDKSRLEITCLNSEDAFVIAENALIADMFDFIIIDSLAKMESKKILDKEMGESAQRNRRAAIVTEFLRRITFTLRKSNTALILINQEIENQDPSPWAPKTVLPCGKQQKYSANLRIELKRSTTLKDGEKKIGYKVNATSLKNKISANEKALTSLTYLYDRGFVREIALVDYLEEIGMITALHGKRYEFKEKNWYTQTFKVGEINKIAAKIHNEFGVDLYSIAPSDSFVFKKNENASDVGTDEADTKEVKEEEVESLDDIETEEE